MEHGHLQITSFQCCSYSVIDLVHGSVVGYVDMRFCPFDGRRLRDNIDR